MVMIAILAIEMAILIPSYRNHEKDLLRHLEDSALTIARTVLRFEGPVSDQLLLQAGQELLGHPSFAGLTFHGPEGRAIGTIGETPQLTYSDALQHSLEQVRVDGGRRFELLLSSEQLGGRFHILARLDSSSVGPKLTEFVWRILGLVLLIAAFASAATLLVVSFLVLRPVLRIRAKLLDVLGDPSEADRFALQHARNDEVGDMVEALNALMSHLSVYRHSELLAIDRRFKDFAQASSDWFWEMDEGLRFSYFSDRFESVTGVPPESLLGKTRQETGIPDVDLAEWQAHLEDLANHRPFRKFQHPRTKPDGSTVHLSISGDPIFSDEGKFRGYRGAGSDVTEQVMAERALRAARDDLESTVQKRTQELQTANSILQSENADRKRAENSLRESEKRYRELFEESPVALFEEDWSLVKIRLDSLRRKGVQDLLAYLGDHPEELHEIYDVANRKEISGAAVALYRATSIEELAATMNHKSVDQDVLDGFRQLLDTFYRGHHQFDYEATERACDGSEIITRIKTVIPAKYDADWSRVYVTIDNVTDEKRAEEQLRQAQKMEAVGQLTGGVAHDFNNLLAIIQGNTELLVDEAEIDTTLTAGILRATKRGKELTQRLLAFSRQQPLQPQSVNLGVLVIDIADLLRRTLGEAIEIECAAPADLWSALADPGQVENALLNLALNARAAMRGRGTLSIKCANASLVESSGALNPEALAGDFVVLEVSDTGVGMTDEVKARAFEPFFTTKEVGDGSGLGLSMVYGFAKQSGGHVSIDSKVDQGTTVRLYLPRVEPAQKAEALQPGDDVPRGRGEVILVVEDDDDLRAITVRMLTGLNYRVIHAPDVTRAREGLSREGRVDLVLSDVVLPGGTSGPEFVEELRDIHPNLPVVFMSGYPTGEARRTNFLGEGKALLNKPFTRHDLAKILHSTLENERLHRGHSPKGVLQLER